MFVLPVEEDHPARHTSGAVFALIGINVAIFLVSLIVGREMVFESYGYVPVDGSVVTGLTSAFLHAGPVHLLGNMLFLWMFGDNVEDVIGPAPFLLAYAFCLVGSILFYQLFSADSEIPLVGASGAVSGIVAMYWVFFPEVRAKLVFYFLRWEIGEHDTNILGAIFTWFAIQAALAILLELSGLDDVVRVAFWAHVGGFFAGVILGALFARLGFVRRFQKQYQRNLLFGYVYGEESRSDA